MNSDSTLLGADVDLSLDDITDDDERRAARAVHRLTGGAVDPTILEALGLHTQENT